MKKAFPYLLFITFVLISNFSFSIGVPPTPPGGMGPPCWPPPCVPIDGGISFLIIAGAAYAGKKIYDKRKVS
jgi:hypothetical protein